MRTRSRVASVLMGLTIAILWAGASAGAGAAGTASAARAAHSRPWLLAYAPGDRLLVRPPFMSFDESWWGHLADFLVGPGVTRREFGADRWGRIRWTRWGSSAFGDASYWFGPTDACNPCRYLRSEVSLRASRVRHGRYSRLEVLYHGTRFRLVYALRPVRLAANGVPHGQLALRWCRLGHPRRCLTP